MLDSLYLRCATRAMQYLRFLAIPRPIGHRRRTASCSQQLHLRSHLHWAQYSMCCFRSWCARRVLAAQLPNLVEQGADVKRWTCQSRASMTSMKRRKMTEIEKNLASASDCGILRLAHLPRRTQCHAKDSSCSLTPAQGRWRYCLICCFLFLPLRRCLDCSDFDAIAQGRSHSQIGPARAAFHAVLGTLAASSLEMKRSLLAGAASLALAGRSPEDLCCTLHCQEA